MPVVVIGADTRLGRLVVERLAGQGLDLRATVDRRDDVAELVELGVKTAVSDLSDSERLGGVVEDAHTVIHLRGGLAALDTIADVLEAAEETSVARIVSIAGVGAEVPAVLTGCPYDVVVVRVARPGRFRRPEPGYDVRVAEAILEADRTREVHGYREVTVPTGR